MRSKLSESKNAGCYYDLTDFEKPENREPIVQKAALSLERRKITKRSERSSDKEHKVDALALGAEEGRDKLR